MEQTAASFWTAVDRAGDGVHPHCNDDNDHLRTSDAFINKIIVIVIITTHRLTASAAGMALVATGLLPSASAPLLTMTMNTVC